MNYQYEILNDAYAFEEFLKDLFNEIYHTKSFELYKTQGAAQHGIDVYSLEKKIAIQGKKKKLLAGKNFSDDLINDFDESIKLIVDLPFLNQIETFILAATTPKYGKVQDHIAEIFGKKEFGLKSIQFLSWEDIEKYINEYRTIREKYYPHLSSNAVQTTNQNLVKEFPKYLTTVPAINSSEFIHRAELTNFQNTIEKKSRVVLLNGIRGVGKTTFAKLFIEENATQYDHIAWIDITTDILNSFTLNVQLLDSLSIDFELLKFCKTIDDQFNLIISRLRNISGKNLLILDNITSDIEKSKIKNNISLKPNWQVIAISRLDLDGFTKFKIDVFQFEEAKKLFLLFNQGSTNSSDKELLELFNIIGFHTLTIELVAKTLKCNSTIKNVTELIGYFNQKKLNDQSWQIKIKIDHSDDEAILIFHLMSLFR